MAEGHPPSPKREGDTLLLGRSRIKSAMTMKNDYDRRSTNKRDNLVFPFYLDRGGEVEEKEEPEEAYYYSGEEDDSAMEGE